MNKNLTPTVITDKNGKTTTVHKKPTGATPISGKMPSPATPAPESNHLTEEVRDELIAKTSETVSALSGGRKLYSHAIKGIMRKSKDATVQALHDYFSEEKTTKYAKRHEFSFMITIANDEDTITSTTIDDYFAIAPSIDLDRISPTQVIRSLPSLHIYPQLPDIDGYNTSDPHTQKQVTAFIIVTDALYRVFNDKSGTYVSTASGEEIDTGAYRNPTFLGVPLEVEPFQKITDPDLVDLVAKYPERAEEISHIILERGITNDITLLKEILTSNTQALREGKL